MTGLVGCKDKDKNETTKKKLIKDYLIVNFSRSIVFLPQIFPPLGTPVNKGGVEILPDRRVEKYCGY